MSNRNSYSVGYRRPPTHSQFKPGKSGNPRGRPKRSVLGFDNFLHQELLSTVLIQTNGKPQKLSKYEVILKQIVKCAMEGDFRFVRMMIDTQVFRSLLQDPNRRAFNSEEMKFLDSVREEAKEIIAKREARDRMSPEDPDLSF